MKLNLWLYKLENKISRFAIENLMTLLAGAMAILYIADIIMAMSDAPSSLYSMLTFDRAAILRGQVWRVFTFLFLYPTDTNPIFVLLSLYFYHWTGTAVERHWGKARFNLYYLFGFIGSIIAGFIVGGMTNVWLNLTIFLAFAVIYPDLQVLLFFIIPIKVKWLGLIEGILLILVFIFGNIIVRAALIVCFLNFLLFFGNDLIRMIKQKYQEYKWRHPPKR